MQHLIRICFAVAAVWFLQTASLAIGQDETSPSESKTAVIDIDGLARKAETIMALILEHHIDPPAPADMWLAAIRSLQHTFPNGQRKRVFELPDQVPPLDTPQARRDFLVQVLTRDVLARWQADREDRGDETGFLFHQFVEGMTPQAGRLASALELKREASIQANRYVGIGIAIHINKDSGYPAVSPLPGGPMEKAGGKQGDLILRIDGQDTHLVSVTRAIELLAGEEGTTVTLELRGASDRDSRTAVVTRGHIPLPSLAGIEGSDPKSADHRIKSDPRIRYIKVNQIKGSTVHELRQLERQFRAEGARAVIIDFRMTHGQDVHHMLLLADALLDGGVIGRLRTKERVQEFHADRERLFRDMPLAVLVDQNTSGSGEWIAAALQDNHAAVVVGERTAGNSFVSAFIPVPGEDAFVHVPTGLFERPSGQPFQTTGIRGVPASGGIVPDRITTLMEQELTVLDGTRLLQQFRRRRTNPNAVVIDPVQTAVRELTSRLQ